MAGLPLFSRTEYMGRGSVMASAWRQSGVLVGAFVVAALVAARAEGAYPETREYLLGDIDGINYNGAGSVDDVYVDPGFRSWYDNGVLGDPGSRYANGVQGFDVLSNDHALLFTFVFGLAGNESVVGASLTVAMRAVSSVSNDRIDLEPDRGGYADTFFRYDFADLGWLPISSTGTTLRTIDLANALGCYDHTTVADNLLLLLQDGKFNVMVHDDEAIDYAKLTLEITPEPATLGLLAAGIGAIWLKRRRKA